jgi:hypothetical protein
MSLTFYRTDGAINHVLSGDQSVIDLNKSTSSNWVEGAWDGETHYVLDGVATERPANPATLDGLTLNNLPVPCKIVINSTYYDCTDDTAELEFDYAGTYKVIIEAFPYLNAEFEIET